MPFLPGKNSSPRVLGLFMVFAVLIFDQASKLLLLDFMDGGKAQGVAVTSFFNLVLVWNRGVSFGMLSGAEQVMPYALSALALLITAFLTRWMMKTGRPCLGATLGLVIGGALGNVIDRLRFGAVVDFADFHLAAWHWPAFNVADSAISIGVGLLLIDSLLPSKEKKP